MDPMLPYILFAAFGACVLAFAMFALLHELLKYEP